jgi:hypothetical protein
MKNRMTIRLDERTVMILKEISDKTKIPISVVSRAFLHKSIDEAIDEEGNIISNEEKKKQE